MSNGLKFKVEGLETTLSYIKMVTSNVAAAVQKEVEEGAKAVRDRARRLAPVKTGGLKRRIVTQKGKRGITEMVRAKAPHSHLQEFGTKRGVKAKFFMKRAAEELLPSIEAKIKAAVAKEVK